jgi:hypothetical protein
MPQNQLALPESGNTTVTEMKKLGWSFTINGDLGFVHVMDNLGDPQGNFRNNNGYVTVQVSDRGSGSPRPLRTLVVKVDQTLCC